MFKKKFLIINQLQFGYHSDTYYYCKYLRTSFEITYICWDYKKKPIMLKGINVIYISRRGNILSRNIRFIFQVIREVKNAYDCHLIKYFRGCSFIKFVYPKKKFLLDIRTGSVAIKKGNRLFYNSLMIAETKKFKCVSVISKSLGRKLGLPKKTYILPLGADVISSTNKAFDSMKLLYVGTLYNRNIEHTIEGFSKFYNKYNKKIDINYTIVGNGSTIEENKLKTLVRNKKLGSYIKFAGQIPHTEIKNFFDVHNIGISYIPITSYFDVQPSTKNFEYLLSGIPVIATNTRENKAIINNNNGILINDSAEDFYQGLVHIYTNREKYNSHNIRLDSMPYKWNKIIDDLNLMLHSLMK